jgi:hypothetical protein
MRWEEKLEDMAESRGEVLVNVAMGVGTWECGTHPEIAQPHNDNSVQQRRRAERKAIDRSKRGTEYRATNKVMKRRYVQINL